MVRSSSGFKVRVEVGVNPLPDGGAEPTRTRILLKLPLHSKRRKYQGGGVIKLSNSSAVFVLD